MPPATGGTPFPPETGGRAPAAPAPSAFLPARRPRPENRPPLRRPAGENPLQAVDWTGLLRAVGARKALIAAVTAVALGAGVLGAVKVNRPRFDARASLLYRPERQKQLVSASGSSFAVRGLARPTAVGLLRRGRTMEQIIANLKLPLTVDELKWMTRTSSEKNSEIVLLDVSGAPTAGTAIGIANELARAAIADNAAFYRGQALDAKRQFEAQADEARKVLEAAARALTEFQATNRLMEASADIQAFYDAAAAAAERLSNAQVEKRSLAVRIENYRRLIKDMPDEIVRESYENSPLKRRISNTEVALMEARTKYGPDNPRVKALEEEILEMRRMVSDQSFDQNREQVFEANPTKQQFAAELLKLEAEQQVAERNVDQLAAELAQVERRFEHLPRQQLQFAALQQRRAAADDMVRALKRSADDAALAADLDLADFELLEPARRSASSRSPLVGVLPVLGLLFGLAGGVALAAALAFLDPRWRTRRQVELALQIPAIVEVRRRNDLSPANAYAHLLPLCRRIYERWTVWNSERPCRSIAVLGSVPGEGRSTVAWHAARYFSSMNLRVACVDFDGAPNPWIHAVRPEAGLESFLRGIAPWERARSEADGVTVFKVATPTPDLVELLRTPAMGRFWGMLSSSFDMILLEGPGTPGDPAGAFLAEMADRFVCVIGAGIARRDEVLAALEPIDRNGLSPDLAVVNLVDPRFAETPDSAGAAGAA